MNACRHFLGLWPRNKPSCRVGRDVRAWAIRCNGGSEHGIALRLPCSKQHGQPPLFDCPELDRKTDAEVEATKAALSARMDRFIKALPELNKMKAKMVANKMPTTVATCPWCSAKDALRLSVALGVNNHMRASCSACGEGFLE